MRGHRLGNAEFVAGMRSERVAFGQLEGHLFRQAAKAIPTVTVRNPSDQRSASRDIGALDACASSTSRTIPA